MDGGGVAEGLARVAPDALEALRKGERGGTLDEVFRDLADLSEGPVPPEGSLARDLHEVFSELARLFEEGLPMIPALGRAATLPVRKELREALGEMAKAGSFIDVMKSRPRLFSPTTSLMVRQSENRGNLEHAFRVLADGVKSGAYLPRNS